MAETIDALGRSLYARHPARIVTSEAIMQSLRGVTLVALLFLLEGCIAVTAMALRLSQGFLRIDLNVLGIPICFGLMRSSRGWRTLALITLWGGMLAGPVVAIASVVGRSPWHVSILGIRIGDTSASTVYAVAVLSFLLDLWQYRTLTRDHVRAAFRVGEYARSDPEGNRGTP
jgi:hypothetical protein